jgi:hypothetical protein
MATLQLKYHWLLRLHICKNNQSKTIVTCVDVTLFFYVKLASSRDYNQDLIFEVTPKLEWPPFLGELNLEIIHGFKWVLWQFLSRRRNFPKLLEWTNQSRIILKFYCSFFSPQLSLSNSIVVHTHFFLSNSTVI